MLIDTADDCITITHMCLFEQESQLVVVMNVRCLAENKRYCFKNVSSFEVAPVSYPIQMMGFQIRDHIKDGWSKEERYEVLDYEDNIIHFFCSDYELCKNNSLYYEYLQDVSCRKE